jgi:hypothetical protein
MSELQNAAKWDMALTNTGQCPYSVVERLNRTEPAQHGGSRANRNPSNRLPVSSQVDQFWPTSISGHGHQAAPWRWRFWTAGLAVDVVPVLNINRDFSPV